MNTDRIRIWNGALAALAVTTALSTSVLADENDDAKTRTPIEHLVVIFFENHTFDNYFATYPNAANPKGEPQFVATDDTPTVNGLTAGLLTNNPNVANPQRLDRVASDLVTCSNDHGYTDEQKAVDSGLMDNFNLLSCTDNLSLDYYDGNTVTALWNYAQHFALNDNSFGSTFGPSTPGALNLASGETHAIGTLKTLGNTTGDVLLAPYNTIIGDPDPIYDDCGSPDQAGFEANGALDNHNVGDLLNRKGVTWGWFQGGFTPTSVIAGKAVCNATTVGHPGVDPANPADPIHKPISAYSAHHNPFMYYLHSANPHHLPPTSAANVGKTDQAMHQYELSLFFDAVDNGRMPAVSYLKPARAQDDHPSNSDPLSAQMFLVDTINHLQRSRYWAETAVIIAWDDSDGWYDHVTGPILNPSNVPSVDVVAGTTCGTPAAGAYLGRCGYGPRLPLLVVSPWAKLNFVDHTTTDQTSILRFIEDNWSLGHIDDLDHPSGTTAGQTSFDQLAGSLDNMFDFANEPRRERLFLDDLTGQVIDSD
ncbi:MAG: alkaline phosphatase family protein [Alphaproteobacteria bacterium]|nr:alkaline phosphatase family protein [Alphaproteobacteria bacterium]